MPTIILQFIYTTQGSLFVLCFIFGHSMQVILFCSLNHNIQNHIIGFYFQLLFLQIYVTRQKNSHIKTKINQKHQKRIDFV